MICPECKKMVDPETTEEWFRHLTDYELTTMKDVLNAVYEWDQSAMWVGGQSVLPTELRDAVKRFAK